MSGIDVAEDLLRGGRKSSLWRLALNIIFGRYTAGVACSSTQHRSSAGRSAARTVEASMPTSSPVRKAWLMPHTRSVASLDDEGAAQSVNFGTKDTIEAITAFAEKRDPTYLGY